MLVNEVDVPVRTAELRRPAREQAPDEAWDERWEARWAGHGRVVRWTLTVAALVLCAVVGTVVVAQVDASVEAKRREQGQAQTSATPARGPAPGHGASHAGATLDLVRAWDARRAQAWRDGDTVALAALYVRAASAGRADVDHLRQWKAQGWRVERVAPQLLRVAEVERTERRWVVDVTDRLSGVRAIRGKDSVALPSTGISTRRIVFVQRGDAWRVEQVTAA